MNRDTRQWPYLEAPPPLPQPVARYVVVEEDGFHWLWRRSPAGDMPISPYVNADAARDVAALLNTHVRWEAPPP